MIRVLHKAFDMLEYLAQDAGRRRKLNEIAAQLKLNAGTCANILKTMVQRKYVDQEKARGGYMPGPMVYYLSRMKAYRADLVSLAEPLMADLVKRVNETVLLAVLHGGKRSIIIQINGNQGVQIDHNLFFLRNIYETATGRLLLAHLKGDELRRVIAENGLPGARWPEAASLKKLESVLTVIRRQKLVYHQSLEDIMGVACPIRENDKVIAALGLFLPGFRFKGGHKAAIMQGLASTSAEINRKLSALENKNPREV